MNISRDWKTALKTGLNTICLLFAFFLAIDDVWARITIKPGSLLEWHGSTQTVEPISLDEYVEFRATAFRTNPHDFQLAPGIEKDPEFGYIRFSATGDPKSPLFSNPEGACNIVCKIVNSMTHSIKYKWDTPNIYTVTAEIYDEEENLHDQVQWRVQVGSLDFEPLPDLLSNPSIPDPPTVQVKPGATERLSYYTKRVGSDMTFNVQATSDDGIDTIAFLLEDSRGSRKLIDEKDDFLPDKKILTYWPSFKVEQVWDSRGNYRMIAHITTKNGGFREVAWNIRVKGPNMPPIPLNAGSLTDLGSLIAGGAPVMVDVSEHFTDLEGEPLEFDEVGIEASTPNVVTLNVSEDQNGYKSIMAIEPKNPGKARFYAIAKERDGLSAIQNFTVLVESEREHTPVVVDTIPAQTLEVGGFSTAVDVSTHFRDPQGKTLTYTAEPSNSAVVTTQLVGSELTLWSWSVGITAVTVTATNPNALSAQQTFTVTVTEALVQQKPETVGTISEQNLILEGPARPIDVGPYFSSPNKLIYAAASDPPGIVTERVSGSQVTLTPVQKGSTSVTVTARDSRNRDLSATQTIPVTVRLNSVTIVRPPAPPEDSYVPVEGNVIVRPPSPEAPDLIIFESSITVDKTTVKPGETFQIDARVWNKGRAVSSATTLRYFLSADGTISSEEDTEVDSTRVNQLSGRGATSSRRRVDVSRTLTAPDTPGIHYYGLCIDAVAGESNTSNNCSETIRITVETPPTDPAASEDPTLIPRPEDPDLVIRAARVEKSTIKLGGGFRLHITLENRGMRPAPATTLRYYRSLDATISREEDTEVRAVPINQIGAGRQEITWALLPSPTSLGVYYYGACIDEVASEADTSNNCSDVFRIAVERQGGGTQELFPIGTISTQELEVEGLPVVLDVTNNFFGQVKRYTVHSSHVNVVTAVMSGSKVTLIPGNKGWSLVTILANRDDFTAKQSFFVSVGGVPVPKIEVFIPDTKLRAAVRSALNLTEGDPLTEELMRGLTTLSANARGIRNLAGLEYAPGLTTLSLGSNRIDDLRPLKDLRNLKELILWKNNTIDDLRPLKDLRNLRRLALDINQIDDLTPLENLRSLEDLSLGGNQISNVFPLQGLTSLEYLWLVGNKISDVTPLLGLTSLKKLWLRGNPIEDLALLRSLQQRNPGIFIDIKLGGQAPSIPILPDETTLLSNYPNPFNPETWIPYQLAAPADVSLTIYDARGAVVRRLALGHQPVGFYRSRSRAAYWDGRNHLGERVANGIYFCTFTAGEFTATRKMIIRK